MNEEDRSRLEEFRQFRKEVRGSSEYLLVGIDVAKDKHYAFFGTATGKTLFKRLVFENSRKSGVKSSSLTMFTSSYLKLSFIPLPDKQPVFLSSRKGAKSAKVLSG